MPVNIWTPRRDKVSGFSQHLEKGMLYDAREMLLEALDAKFPSKVPAADLRYVLQGETEESLLGFEISEL